MALPRLHLETLPVIETERLRLRPLQPDDARALFEAFGDPVAMRYWNSPPHADVRRTERMLDAIAEGFARRTVLQWGVELRAGCALVGTITLLPAESQPRAELGFIISRRFWRLGYGSEAQRAICDFAFDELGLNRLEADVHPSNRASLSSLERLGFRREGMLRERWCINGVSTDSVMLGLLAREWAQQPDSRPSAPEQRLGG